MNETTHVRPSKGSVPVFSEIIYAFTLWSALHNHCFNFCCSICNSSDVFLCRKDCFVLFWIITERLFQACSNQKESRKETTAHKYVAKINPATARSGPTAGSVTPPCRLQLDPTCRSLVGGRACLAHRRPQPPRVQLRYKSRDGEQPSRGSNLPLPNSPNE